MIFLLKEASLGKLHEISPFRPNSDPLSLTNWLTGLLLRLLNSRSLARIQQVSIGNPPLTTKNCKWLFIFTNNCPNIFFTAPTDCWLYFDQWELTAAVSLAAFQFVLCARLVRLKAGSLGKLIFWRAASLWRAWMTGISYVFRIRIVGIGARCLQDTKVRKCTEIKTEVPVDLAAVSTLVILCDRATSKRQLTFQQNQRKFIHLLA